MNVSMQAMNVPGSARMGNLSKSTQDRLERQQKCAGQVDFFEKQKENLKKMECGSLEEIARKLEMFHSYEDQIAAAKKQYNDSQMSHVLDEAREIGEKIAKAAEEMKPKTPEERRKEMLEEAAGKDDESKGMLSEIMEEMEETIEELEEKLEEELQEELQEKEEENLGEGLSEAAKGVPAEDAAGNLLLERMEEKAEAEKEQEALLKASVFQELQYRHIDYRL